MNVRTPAVPLALLGAFALGALALSAAPLQRGPQWEYTVVRGGGLNLGAPAEELEAARRNAEQTLNGLGNDGWELVDVENGYAVMKRLK